MNNMNVKLVAIAVVSAVALIGSVTMLSYIEKVPAGYVGVKAYLLGSSKGVDTEVLGPGRYFIGINQELYKFPTFTQTVDWHGPYEAEDGNRYDNRLSFQDIDGLKISAGVGLTYAVDKTKAAELFQKYRRGVDEITSVYLRNMIRDALVIEASKMKVDDIYGAQKESLIKRVEERVRRQVEKIGINVERIYWSGDMALPQAVMEALNAKIAATQQAQQRENQLRTAEAQAKIVQAEAEGEATSITLRAEAEAKANRIVQASLTPELIRYEIAKKWNGKLPQVQGSSTPIIDLRD